MLSVFLDRSCTSTACGETRFFKIKIVRLCHSLPQLTWNSTEVCYRTRAGKAKPRKVILAVKQLSLIKAVLIPKVEILPLFLRSLTSKGKHFGCWQPEATRRLQQQPRQPRAGSRSSLIRRPSRSAAAAAHKGISGVFNIRSEALLFDVSHKLFPLLMVKHIYKLEEIANYLCLRFYCKLPMTLVSTTVNFAAEVSLNSKTQSQRSHPLLDIETRKPGGGEENRIKFSRITFPRNFLFL